MIQPKDCPLKRQDGTEAAFVLHKFDAIAGREIVANYPVSNLPKLGEYRASEAIMLKAMAFVGIRLDGRDEPLMLATRDLINNHVQDWETLAKLEWAVLEYNCSFFGNGLTSVSFGEWMEKARPWISQMLTALSEQSSAPDKPISTS